MNAPVSNFKPVLAVPSAGSARTIGDILVAYGRLTPADAARILDRQKKDQSQFGDAALALKLLDKEDIDFALSKQFDYAYLSSHDASLSPELVSAYKPFSKAGENLRAVRSQLMMRWFSTNPPSKALTVLSPGKGEGRSFVAANLAVVFAQHGERTLLIDGDLRAGRQHALFKLGKSAGLSGLLAGRTSLHEATLSVSSLPGLAVLPAGTVPPNPQELLGRPAFTGLLLEASRSYDVIIIDTPAAGKFADAEVIASRTGAAVMLTRKNVSLMSPTASLAKRLQDNNVTLLGAVLNGA